MHPSHSPKYWIAFWSLVSMALILLFTIFRWPPNFYGGDGEDLSQSTLLSSAQIEYLATEPHGIQYNIKLPDRWDETMPDYQGTARYTLKFDLNPDKPAPNSVYIPRVVMNAKIYLNGVHIGGHGAMEGELLRFWNTPLFFVFSHSLLKPGENILQIDVAGYRNYFSGLGRVWVGPDQELFTLYRAKYLWQIGTSFLATTVATITAIVLLIFSLKSRKPDGMNFLVAAVLLWCVRSVGFFSLRLPIAHEQWAVLMQSSQAFFFAFYGLFILQYIKHQGVWLRLLLWLYPTAVLGYLLTLDIGRVLQLIQEILFPLFVLVIWCNVLLLHHSITKKNLEAVLLASSGLVFFPLSIRDILIIKGVFEYESTLFSHVTGLLFFSSCAWVLIRRYTNAVEEVTALNRDLNATLAMREQQLYAQFSKLRRIEKEKAKDDERRRIMQDIHDGVGSSLLSAMNQNERQPLNQTEVRSVLQECLDDLRMAIDSLDPESEDLLALLGNFRWRYQARLAAAGLELQWRVNDIPELSGYSSRDLFDLLRIIQEIFANILKHSKASVILLRTNYIDHSDQIEIMIGDNGVGIVAGLMPQGRGMKHMKARADALNIGIHFDEGIQSLSTPEHKGTGVTLLIPRERKK